MAPPSQADHSVAAAVAAAGSGLCACCGESPQLCRQRPAECPSCRRLVCADCRRVRFHPAALAASRAAAAAAGGGGDSDMSGACRRCVQQDATAWLRLLYDLLILPFQKKLQGDDAEEEGGRAGGRAAGAGVGSGSEVSDKARRKRTRLPPVVVVPCGALWRVPFAALIAPGGAFFVEQRELRVAATVFGGAQAAAPVVKQKEDEQKQALGEQEDFHQLVCLLPGQAPPRLPAAATISGARRGDAIATTTSEPRSPPAHHHSLSRPACGALPPVDAWGAVRWAHAYPIASSKDATTVARRGARVWRARRGSQATLSGATGRRGGVAD